jgi:nucleotide-binding universal stress UspA family protein
MQAEELDMFERILIPLDGSPRAELILAQVGRILRREDSEILLLRVVDMPQSMGRMDMGALVKSEREEAQKYVHDMARRFSEKGAKVHGRVAEGPPAETILDTARTEGATLIAMTSHGRTGLARWTLGSVAEKVARASDVPVLMVRSFRRGAFGDLEPTAPEELPFRRILVPVDGSPTSMSAIGDAEKFGQLFGSEIVVLHVRPVQIPVGPVLPGMEAGAMNLIPQLPPTEDEVTRRAAERFRHAGLKVTEITSDGDAAAEILDSSAAWRADLIAMGTHGRSGMTRWVLGSVAERVLRSATVPLLFIRTPAAKVHEENPFEMRVQIHG